MKMMKKKYKIKVMSLDRYDELIFFWKFNEGINVSDDDKYEKLKFFLRRNPKLNFIVLDNNNKIIGTIKSSHDGRRGYLHRLAIDVKYRKQGIAKELINLCLDRLARIGIKEFRAFVLDSNIEAINFWKHNNFKEQICNYRTFEKNIS